MLKCGRMLHVAGLLAFMTIAVSVVITYETKLNAFMADMAGEEGLPAMPAVKGD